MAYSKIGRLQFQMAYRLLVQVVLMHLGLRYSVRMILLGYRIVVKPEGRMKPGQFAPIRLQILGRAI